MFLFFKTTFHCVLRLKKTVNRLWSLELDLKVLTYAQGWNIYLFIFIFIYRNSKQHTCSALSCFERVGCNSRPQRERALMAYSVQRLEQQSRSCHGQSADNSRKPEILQRPATAMVKYTGSERSQEFQIC